jgi:sporulation protein YlmC with PRC-barrel domain
MLVRKERFVDVAVMSLQTGSELARAIKPIIDPRQLKIVGFYCEGPNLDIKPAILTIDDIREISQLGFIVDDSGVFVSPDDLVRLKAVIDFGFALEGKHAIEENGRKIGKVASYTIDMESFFIMQLSVQPGLMQAWDTAEVLIGRTQIIEITDTSVIVRSATVHDRVPAAKPLEAPIVANPFKRRHPQPEVPHAAQSEH